MFNFLQKYKNIDMLTGSISDKLIAFSFPLAITSVMQMLFNSADVFTLGHFVSSDAMAGVGNNVPIIGTIMNFIVGLSIGANVVIARYIGQKNLKEANIALHGSLVLALIAGILLFLFGECIASYVVSLLGVPKAVEEISVYYLRVFVIGLPFMSLYNFESALFRSSGNTKEPLIALFWAAIFNFLGNIFVIEVLHMKEGGVAFVTVLANVFACAYLLYKLHKENGILHFDFKNITIPKKSHLRAIVNIGMPAGVQGMVYSISNLVIQSAINSLGTETMAASAAAFTIEINLYCFINAFGLAATTFVSQNYGANNLQRCREITYKATILNLIISGLMAIPVIIYADKILGLFTASTLIVDIAMIRVISICGAQPLTCVMEVLSGAMRGYGYSLPPAIATLICVCGQRLIWVYTVFEKEPTFGTLLATYPISWGITTFVLIVLYIWHRRTLTNKHMLKSK